METSMTDNKKSLPDDGEADTFIGVPDDSFPNRYDDILVDWVSAIDSSTINRPITGGKIVITHTSIPDATGFSTVENELVLQRCASWRYRGLSPAAVRHQCSDAAIPC